MSLLNVIRSSYGSLQILRGLSGFINLFCKSYSKKENRTARERFLIPEGPLNGQGLEPLAEMPYGAWNIKNNGCEAIAAYNALLSLGLAEPFQKVAAVLEERGLLFNGFGGTNLGALVRFFRKRGLEPRVLRRGKRKNFDEAFSSAECAILSYWTGDKLKRKDGSWNTLHTVAVRHCPQGIEICNAWDDRPFPCIASSFLEFIGDTFQPVCLILLNGEKEVDKTSVK